MIGVAPPAYDPAAPTTANTLPVIKEFSGIMLSPCRKQGRTSR